MSHDTHLKGDHSYVFDKADTEQKYPAAQR
jgi:hypothetical protein